MGDPCTGDVGDVHAYLDRGDLWQVLECGVGHELSRVGCQTLSGERGADPVAEVRRYAAVRNQVNTATTNEVRSETIEDEVAPFDIIDEVCSLFAHETLVTFFVEWTLRPPEPPTHFVATLGHRLERDVNVGNRECA